MQKQLAKLFEGIDLVWCDNPEKEIQKSTNYQKLLDIFPNLQSLFQEGLERDPFEFYRTMRHIFRSLKIFFMLQDGTFNYKSLSRDSIQKLRRKLTKFPDKFLLIILMYHDLGKLFDRKKHTLKSSKLIQKNNLFNCFDLSSGEKLLLRKVIEYHLLFATIYTGESTFFGILSLLNDKEFIQLISDRTNVEIFIDLLEIFTYIDILGYPYSQVFDHYLKYYGEINQKLKHLLGLWPNRDEIIALAKSYSLEWMDWRLAGALRIFQFVETKPHLTKEFYFNVLRESVRPIYKTSGQKFDWNVIKSTDLFNIFKFQMKYALAFLLILAFGEFKRFRLKENQHISPKLMQFWVLLSNEVKKRNLTEEEVVWNIYFERLPLWSNMTKSFIKKLEIDSLKTVINNAVLKFDAEKKEYNLNLDFSRLVDGI